MPQGGYVQSCVKLQQAADSTPTSCSVECYVKGCHIWFLAGGFQNLQTLHLKVRRCFCSIAAFPGLRESGRISSSDGGTDSSYASNLLFSGGNLTRSFSSRETRMLCSGRPDRQPFDRCNL